MARRANPGDLHKDDLTRRVAVRTNYPQKFVREIMAGIVDELAEAMMRGDAVVWTGLARFEMRQRGPHGGINPGTGERITIPPKRNPGCSIGVTFKERVRVLTSYPEDEAAD